MLTIICGSDVAASRQRYRVLIDFHKSKGEVFNVNKERILELSRWLYDSEALFSENKIFFCENVLGDKNSREELGKFDYKKKNIDIVIWEEKIASSLVKRFFKNAKVEIFDLPHSIFKFLDSIFPSNLADSLSLLKETVRTSEEALVFFVTCKRLRELIILESGREPAGLATWQINKLKSQAARWNRKKLHGFYQGLYRIERQLKTGATSFSAGDMLELLFCYYLK